jgi:succinate dehydrogenase / fumarate reductase cytochrome b subunit
MSYVPPGKPAGRWARVLFAFHAYPGSWAWVLHRATGIGLTVYLYIHIYALSSLSRGRAAFTEEMKVFSSPFFQFVEWALGALVFFHALNGIRVVLVDLGAGAKYHKKILPAIYLLSGIALAGMAWLMFK